jgi:O-antigen/teichoic acid export membrane protein
MAVEWDRQIAQDLWNFGKWLMGSSALAFLAGYADRLILGALLDAETFGFYVIALMWVQVGNQMIKKLTGSIVFPVLSQVLRERPAQIGAIYRRFSRVIDGICLSAFLAVLFGSPVLVAVLYTEDYATAATFMPLLGVAVLAERFESSSMLMLSHGHSHTMMSLAALRAIAICISLPVGFAFLGIGGALLASALSPLASAPLLIAWTRSILGFRPRGDIAWVGAIIMAAAIVYVIYAP